MRVIKQAMSKINISENRKNRNLSVLRSLLFAILMLSCLPALALAAQERFVLDFNDSHIRGHKGETATIFLKRSLKEQYPWVKVSDLELKKVVLVAKSKKGRGGAGLRVGKWATDLSEVGGSPRSFHDNGRNSFDRVKFWNPSHSSRGRWQLGFRGNIIVRKIVLVVDNHKRRDQYSRWDRNRW